MGQKIFWAMKNFLGWKIFWGEKFFGMQNFLGHEKFFVSWKIFCAKKNFLCHEKFFGMKNFRPPGGLDFLLEFYLSKFSVPWKFLWNIKFFVSWKIFCAKKNFLCHEKFFGPWKIFWPRKKFLAQKKFFGMKNFLGCAFCCAKQFSEQKDKKAKKRMIFKNRAIFDF